ncbi:aminotransferase class IV [Microseira wollei]|uniref:aminotransferase class IV n=1 Tax=Microseira wollei TaxID=467598 RepID=UPI001CFD773E
MFWHNGNLIEGKTLELAIDDPGLLYGATVFTTLRVYDGNLDHPQTNWLAHLRRLSSSLQSLNWQIPNWELVRQGAEILKQHFPVLRITIFPDGREWITGRNLPADLTERQKYGIAAWVAERGEWGRSLPTHKTGNYLSAWLALQQAQKYGAKEAILVDASGNWLETSTGNLWGWQDGRWWTPPLDAGILPGLMREQLINRLHSQNETVGEEPWTADFVAGLEAIAYSNSVVEVVPIHTIVRSRGAEEQVSRGAGEQVSSPITNYQLPITHHPVLLKLRP